ncbi:hypothetical protein CSB69_3446 [Morganella morganii]|uniref:hypothetical protein n=1 Tax=Morganella morganii TaxID=582 RepID=UPI000D225353|nr:hypothetical protein [Morganella morganii]AVK38498.1 hypothetical protein CSB69_3446 [Morganella morganii]
MFSYSSDPVVFNYDDGAAGRDYLTRSGKPLKQKASKQEAYGVTFRFFFTRKAP